MELMLLLTIEPISLSMKFPPSRISKVIKKIEDDLTEGIVIVATFPTQIWFTRLIRILVSGPFLILESKKALFFPYRRNDPPQFPGVKLLA